MILRPLLENDTRSAEGRSLFIGLVPGIVNILVIGIVLPATHDT